MKSQLWFEDRLRSAGFPVRRTTHRGAIYMFGPLRIRMTKRTVLPRLFERFGHEMNPGEGKAQVFVLGSNSEPGTPKAQVVMDLESFTQIVQWLCEGDPEMFLREIRYRKGTEG